MILDLTGLEVITFDPIVFGPYRWEFTSEDLPAAPCMVLEQLMRQWYSDIEANRADADAATFAKVNGFEEKLPGLLAAIMGQKYPEWTVERIAAELPKGVRGALAGAFFTYWRAAPDSYIQSLTAMTRLDRSEPAMASSEPATAPSSSSRRPKRDPVASV